MRVMILAVFAAITSGCVMPGDLARVEQSQGKFESSVSSMMQSFQKEMTATQDLANQRRDAALAELQSTTQKALADLKEGTISEVESEALIREATEKSNAKIAQLDAEYKESVEEVEERAEAKYNEASEKFNRELASTIAASEQRTQALISVLSGTVDKVATTVEAVQSGQLGWGEAAAGFGGAVATAMAGVQYIRNRKYTRAGQEIVLGGLGQPKSPFGGILSPDLLAALQELKELESKKAQAAAAAG